jgi:hypothetical protein
MSESNPTKPVTAQFKTCLFEVSKLPVERFRKPTDGRKWKAAASARKTMLVQLAAYADSDGTSIRPSTQTLAEQTGFSRRKVCYLLDDLRELGFMERTGRLGQKGPAIRRLKLPEKSPLRVSDSVSESATLDLESARFASQSAKYNPESATAVAHNLPLQTCPTDPPSKPVRKTDELRDGMASAFSKARPEEKLSWAEFSDIETLAEEFGNESVCKVWKQWLKNRNTHGMRLHFQWFRKEFDTVRADLECIEREQKAFEKMRDAAYAADDAKTQRENDAIRLRREEEKAKPDTGTEGLFG